VRGLSVTSKKKRNLNSVKLNDELSKMTVAVDDPESDFR
jgi:hypothetical protein